MTPQDFVDRVRVLFDNQTSALVGPMDIIVRGTDKSVNGIKYSNVPFALLVGGGVIAFPNGDNGKKGLPVIVFTSNWTVRTK
jgi:hypothetical protein